MAMPNGGLKILMVLILWDFSGNKAFFFIFLNV
jgi:hypothetical protein